MTMTDFCDEIKNWFCIKKKTGNFEIYNGEIKNIDDFLQVGQYFRIIGSVFNDGVYIHPASLIDESFKGAVWAMAVPPAAVALFEEIQRWDEKYSQNEAANSPFQSESFGGYSYSKSNVNTGGSSADWRSQYKFKLNHWRKV